MGLEPYGPESGVRAHERTLAEPREDRYRLLRATGVNTSPVVGLAEDRSGRVAGWLRDVAARPPVIELTDDAGVEHRLWVAAVGQDPEEDEVIAEVCARLGAHAITLADGHHRYETALRYARTRHQDSDFGRVARQQPQRALVRGIFLGGQNPRRRLTPAEDRPHVLAADLRDEPGGVPGRGLGLGAVSPRRLCRLCP